MDPSFQLPLKLDRHEAAKLLPARVNNITFNSVISDDGVMLTQARLEMLPGDKRLLNLTLPKGANFWFAFVNHNGVWPWRDGGRDFDSAGATVARRTSRSRWSCFTAARSATSGSRALDLELLAPKFDLPLENITWRVSSERQMAGETLERVVAIATNQIVAAQPARSMCKRYLQNEATCAAGEDEGGRGDARRRAISRWRKGDPQQARRSFQSAYGLSQDDDAFNEDARVQLQQSQAPAGAGGIERAAGGVGGRARAALSGQIPRFARRARTSNYTQQDAKDIIDRNTRG